MKRTVASEQYFTHPKYAQRCIDLLRQHYELSDFDFLVEPSAGAGVFVDLLQDYPMQAVDIEPHHPRVEKGDFFAWWPQTAEGSKILTIGNPPFGQRSALAVRFINRAAEFSDVVAFILPRAFNKYTFQNRVDPFFPASGTARRRRTGPVRCGPASR
jgi:predicted RNA methylase